MKRNLLLAIALVFCATLFLGFAPAGKAHAAELTLNKLNAYEYAFTYLLEEAGVEKLDADKSSVMDGRYVKINGVEAKASTDVQETRAKGFICSDAFVEFITEGTYTVEVFQNGAATAEKTFKIDTTKKPTTEDIKYNLTDIDVYKAQVAEAATDLAVNDTFTVPSATALVDSKFFDSATLTRTIWYAAPQKASYSSLGSTKTTISITDVGVYSFYILYSDTFGNAMSVSDLVVGTNGWYEKDADGNPTGDVIIPIFTFEVAVASTPEVVVGVSEPGFIGLKYSVECFTITASNYNTSYKLYYTEAEVVQNEAETQEAYIARVKQAARFKDVTNLLDTDNLTFTPDEAGYYYVELYIVDGANNCDTVLSKAINATKAYQKVELEDQFFTYNWQSIVFLSIAFVCLVAIIVILCVKPSEKKNDLVVKQ